MSPEAASLLTAVVLIPLTLTGAWLGGKLSHWEKHLRRNRR